MRQWLVNPKLLCTQHLLGEHVECHMFVGSIRKGISIQGYVDKGLVDTSKIVFRHNELVKEMTSRGFKHDSPLPIFAVVNMGHVDSINNIYELKRRCLDCRFRIENILNAGGNLK